MDFILQFIEEYINLAFLISVLFGVEAFNKYIPQSKKIKNQTVTLLVSTFLVFIFFYLEQPQDFNYWRVNIFISWLASIGMYDFIIKPVKNKIKNKTQNE